MDRTVVAFACLLIAFSSPAMSEGLFAARTLRAKSVISADDLKGVADGALAPADFASAIRREARVTIFAGRPVREGDLQSPALVERNAIVPLAYTQAGLTIRTEGRALSRGAAGDVVRVMNLGSRATVTGIVGPDGAVRVIISN